jgi:coproporphyrinogen III oxidase-like Fe-S oxidoreductase
MKKSKRKRKKKRKERNKKKENDPKFGLFTGPPFPQSFVYFCLCNSFTQEQLWVRILAVG